MKIEFYHTFNLPDGRTFKGQWDLNPTAEHFEQIDVKGKTLLDSACRDGWYSFLFEKMGADVTGLDLDDRSARRFMAGILNSKIKFSHMNAFSLASLAPKMFDVVFTGDILCHLDNPLGYLRVMNHIAKEKFYLVADTFLATEVLQPGYPWRFSEADLMKMLWIAGFKNITVLSRYIIPGPYWGYDRNVSLFSCDRDQDWIIHSQESELIPKEKSINYIPEMTYEIEGVAV